MENKKEINAIAISPTLGMLRVKAEFNPEKNDDVSEIKNHSARIIDFMEHVNTDPENHPSLSNTLVKQEMGKLTAYILRDGQGSEERRRIIELAWRYYIKGVNTFSGSIMGYNLIPNSAVSEAQTHIETACMYAVKAVWTK